MYRHIFCIGWHRYPTWNVDVEDAILYRCLDVFTLRRNKHGKEKKND